MTGYKKTPLHLLNTSGKSIYCTGRAVRVGGNLQLSVTNSPAHVTCLACLRRMYKAKREASKYTVRGY